MCFQALVSANRALLVQDIWWIVQMGSQKDYANVLSRSRDLLLKDMERYVVDISKGLVQCVDYGSRVPWMWVADDDPGAERTVRFAHESIVEFGLKHGGFDEPNDWLLGPDFLVRSHAFMRECCSRLLSTEVIESLVSDLPESESMTASGYLGIARRNRTSRIWSPMIPPDIWRHAEAAHAGGIDQSGFLASVDLKAYVLYTGLYEVYCSSTNIQQLKYKSTTTLLYVLMERGCSTLIRSCQVQAAIDCPRFGLEEGNGFHETPITAALLLLQSGAITAVMDLYLRHKCRDPGLRSICQPLAKWVNIRMPILVPEFNRGRCYEQGLLVIAAQAPLLATFFLVALVTNKSLPQDRLDDLREVSHEGFAQTVNFMLRWGISTAALELERPKAETLTWALAQPFQPLAEIVIRRFELLPTSSLTFSTDNFPTTGIKDLFVALKTGFLRPSDLLGPHWSRREERSDPARENSFYDLRELIRVYQNQWKDSRHVQARSAVAMRDD